MSQVPDGPPTLLNALPVRVWMSAMLKLYVWLVVFVEVLYGNIVALSDTVDEGQKKPALVPVHCVMLLSLKKNPLDPLSM